MTLESHASGWRDLGTVGWSVVQRKRSFSLRFGTGNIGKNQLFILFPYQAILRLD